MAKWYIIHTVSGSEKSVKKKLEEQIAKANMFEFFEQIIVPVVEVPGIKRGKKVLIEKKVMPGYILLKAEMTEAVWHLVMSVAKVTGFLGSKKTPQSLTDAEVQSVLKTLENESKMASASSIYNVGDKVQVIDGPFDSFSGVVEEVDADVQRVKVSVSIFGKATPIELTFTQVKKI
jgi:transcriptional antiterminator NusG